MKILRIVLETINIEKMKEFYSDILEMPIVREKEGFITFRAGNSHITFNQSENNEAPLYHFALRTNLVFYDYMFSKMNDYKVNVLPDSEGNMSGYWKGKQVYFTDPDGNIVEILERDIKGKDSQGWIDVCEIGYPCQSVEEMSGFLSPIQDLNQSESDTFRFYGDELGTFVLVKEGRHWYPTNRPATIHPLVVEVEGEHQQILNHTSMPYTVKVKKPWLSELPVVQMRIARPTDKLDKIIEFYEGGLGLQKVGEFRGHQGYDGVMYGLPDLNYHLEFTSHVEGTPCPAPTKDNLLVLYLPNWDSIYKVTSRLEKMGYPEVEAENPYWRDGGITVEDPDGWRVVMYCSTGL